MYRLPFFFKQIRRALVASGDFGNNLVVHAAFDQQARTCRAHLAAVEEHRREGVVDGRLGHPQP